MRTWCREPSEASDQSNPLKYTEEEEHAALDLGVEGPLSPLQRLSRTWAPEAEAEEKFSVPRASPKLGSVVPTAEAESTPGGPLDLFSAVCPQPLGSDPSLRCGHPRTTAHRAPFRKKAIRGCLFTRPASFVDDFGLPAEVLFGAM
jgi:hypothetical protein